MKSDNRLPIPDERIQRVITFCPRSADWRSVHAEPSFARALAKNPSPFPGPQTKSKIMPETFDNGSPRVNRIESPRVPSPLFVLRSSRCRRHSSTLYFTNYISLPSPVILCAGCPTYLRDARRARALVNPPEPPISKVYYR